MRLFLDTLVGRLQCTRRAGALALSAFLVVGSAACGDDPFEIRWTAQPDTVLLYSLARPELNVPSGFNFNARSPVVIEAPGSTGQWDIALDTRQGQLAFVLPGTFDIQSRARITSLPGLTFAEVTEAPSDTAAYVAKDPVPVQIGTVYVVQTDTRRGSFGRSCVYYAKLEPLATDPVQGTLRFVYDASPVCNDRRLVPPGD